MKTPTSLCILGRQPELGLAELESLYRAEHVQPAGNAALLDLPAEEINFKRLGGVIKTARILAILPYTDWPCLSGYLKDIIPEHLAQLPEGKFTLGISAYDLPTSVANINKTSLEIKKIIKVTGRPVRVVPNKTLELNSAQVLHNQLTHKGAWELLLVSNGQNTILAQTLFVQDIEAYAARDQARPDRDARVGMLPPKLAQILINLVNPANGSRILDPFCGTGVVLQEAMLMGYSVLGADIEPRLVDYARRNLEWLVNKYPSIEAQAAVEIGDATNYKWPRFSAIVSEVYLGQPLTTLPARDKLKEIINDTNTVIRKFLRNLEPQLKSSQQVVLAVPAWRDGQKFIHLPLVDQLTDMGYTYLDLKHVARAKLVYFREDQTVARQILRIAKK